VAVARRGGGMPRMSTAPAERVDFLAVEGPHGDLFPRLRRRADADAYRLDAGAVARYHEQGFIGRLPIIDQRQVARLRDGLDAIIHCRTGREAELICRSQDDPAASKRLTYLQGAWMIDEAIHDLVFHPAITVAAAQLLGTPRVRFWHDQVFAKPPRQGGNVAWHQDYSYWKRATPSQHLTFWIGLDDSTLENGCLHVVPGSHRWGLLEMEDLMGDMEGVRKQLPPERAAKFSPQPLEQPAGTCSIHHDHTIHGSYRNESDRPRRAIILNYMADGTRSDAADGKLMDGFNLVPKGEVIRGRLFPLAIDLDALPA